MNWTKSPVYRRYITNIFIGILLALGTVALGYLENDDLLQGAWVFISATVTATIAFRRRLREDDTARYTRVAQKHFNYWLKNDPSLVQGLFASNIPYSLIDWFKEDTGCDLLQCRNPHVIDSWAKKGDQPGQLIFRAGIELGKILQENQGKEKELNEIFSQKFEQFSQEWKQVMGEEIAPGIFFKEIKEGDYRPAGVHMSNPHSECLALIEKNLREGKGKKPEEIITVAVGLKKERLEHLNEEQWQQVKETLYKHFAYFRPAAAGSGPQKQAVPLFIQCEKSLTEEEAKQFPQQMIAAYDEIKQIIAPADKEE